MSHRWEWAHVRRLHQTAFPLQSRLLDLRHDVLVQLPDLFFDESHVLQTVTDHLPVVIAYAMAFQRRDDLWDLLLGTPLGKLRDLRRLRLALEQRIQHQLPRDSEYIGKHIAQLHVGVFQDLLYTVLLAGPRSQQFLPPPRQIPQLPNRPRGNKTGMNHGVPQQVRQPPSVLVIGLVSLAYFYFLRVGHVNFPPPSPPER